jgi:hypothetical protein
MATLKKLAHQEPQKWDTMIHTVLAAYRNRVHTNLKVSLYESLYGVSRSEVSVMLDPNHNFRVTYQSMAHYYSHNCTRLTIFQYTISII